MRIHRPYISLLGITATLALLTGVAAAQEATYAATFEEVTSNCDRGVTLRIDKGSLRLIRQGESVQIHMPAVPVLQGTQRKGGKLSASSKTEEAGGIRKRFTVSGRADESQIQLLFIAEIFQGETSVCSQSWNVSGRRR